MAEKGDGTFSLTTSSLGPHTHMKGAWAERASVITSGSSVATVKVCEEREGTSR